MASELTGLLKKRSSKNAFAKLCTGSNPARIFCFFFFLLQIFFKHPEKTARTSNFRQSGISGNVSHITTDVLPPVPISDATNPRFCGNFIYFFLVLHSLKFA